MSNYLPVGESYKLIDVPRTSKKSIENMANTQITDLLGDLKVSGGVSATNFTKIDGTPIAGPALPAEVIARRDTAGKYTIVQLKSAGSGLGSMFINDSDRADEGGNNAMTVRNEVGNLRLLAKDNIGLTIVPATTSLNNNLVITKGTSAASGDRAIEINEGAGKPWTYIHNNLIAATNNPMIQNGDHAITFSNGQIDDTASFVIAPWSATSKGIRVNNKGLTVNGSMTVGGVEVTEAQLTKLANFANLLK